MSTDEYKVSIWDKLIPNLERKRFPIISLAIIVVSGLGGIVIGFGAIDSIFQLSLVVIPALIGLAIILADAPMSWIINLSILAVIIDFIILIVNLL